MMIHIGIGDAYGSCFENCDSDFVEANNDLTYSDHPRKRKRRDWQPSLVPSGHYTDDTQMAIALAEAMLESDEWTKESLADRFVQVFRRNERRGYTPYFFHILLNSKDGKDMLSKIGGNSTKSGAAMRAGPVGLFPTIAEVIRRSRIQATVTHDSWLGQNSAVCAALMTHYFYYDVGPKVELCNWLKEIYFGDSLHNPEPFQADGEVVLCWAPERKKKVRVHSWDCIEAAIYAIESSSVWSEILRTCISYTGDCDSVAAIAMGAASLSREIDQDMPGDLLDNLENKKYGRSFLEELDQRLFAKFPQPDLK